MKRTAWLVCIMLAACKALPAAPTPDINHIYILAAQTVYADAIRTATQRRAAATTAAASPNLATLAVPSTSTLPPTPNQTHTAQAMMFRPHGDGFYLIGVDIAPGSWRSESGHPACYWTRTNTAGYIIANRFGTSGDTVRLFSTDFQVEFQNCGMWTYLGP